MLGTVDHLGYLCLELEEAAEEFGGIIGFQVARRFQRPEFSVCGLYLGAGEGNVESFTLSDRELAERQRVIQLLQR